MPRLVVEVPTFGESVAAHARTRDAGAVVAFLIKRATSFPEAAAPLADCNLRVVISHNIGNHPVLALCYSVDDKAIYLIDIRPWEEVEGSF